MALGIEPAEISFDLKDKEPSVLVVLTNNSNIKKAFKVKTTMPRRYLVRPNQDIIEGGEKLEVRISLQSKDAIVLKQALLKNPEVENDLKDKFLIQSIALTQEYDETIATKVNENDQTPMSEILAPLWKNAPADELTSRKFKCKFTVPKEKEMDDVAVEQLRKNYNNLLTNTIKITNERDVLKSSYAEVTKELEELKKASPGSASAAQGGQKQRTGFSLIQVLAIAIISFVIALFLDINIDLSFLGVKL